MCIREAIPVAQPALILSLYLFMMRGVKPDTLVLTQLK